MASEGPNFPGTMANDSSVGGWDWDNIDNAKADDGASASLVLFGPETSHYLKATNFGFSIPAGATIDGIEVNIKKATGGFGGTIIDNSVRLVVGGSIVGNDKAIGNWSDSFETITYGGSSDLWGLTPSVSQINSSDFGGVISALFPDVEQANIDFISITVYYTTGEGGTTAQINIGDVWKEVPTIQINIGDVWKEVIGAQINIGDVWKEVF